MASWQRTALWLLVLIVVLSRLAHLDLVWIEEAYGMAAGAELLRGKTLYRDVWFDKPPLYAVFYAFLGSSHGVILRLAGAAVVLAACYVVYRLAVLLWSRDEGVIAALLVGFGLVFWIPSAVVAAAPDLLMVGPHVGAVYFAVRGKGFWAGIAAGLATLCNSKGLLVVPVCIIWRPTQAGAIIAGWALPQLASLLVLPVEDYWRQVWAWGFAYSADTFVAHPLLEGVKRTANWAGFHAAVVIGAIIWFTKDRDWRLAVWIVISLGGVIGGLRFFPRYYFQLLPAMALVGARGLLLMPQKWRLLVLATLLIPVVRFGPTYVRAATGGAADWGDVRMMRDSREVGEWLRTHSRPGDTVLVWGYRPDMFVYSGLAAGTPFLDSQPLTGVLADRHLTDSVPTFPELAFTNRRLLRQTRPTYVVDGLGLLNEKLAIHQYSDLGEWLSEYDPVARTGMSVIYRFQDQPWKLIP